MTWRMRTSATTSRARSAVSLFIWMVASSAATPPGDLQRFVFMGDTVEFGTFPWFATLFVELEGGFGTYICGSVLAAEKYVVTAAHCLENAEFIPFGYPNL